jgi:predicted amidohydrolase
MLSKKGQQRINPPYSADRRGQRSWRSQAGCYVIAVGGMRSHADTPERYRELSTIEYAGDSCIIDPRGEIVAGPAVGETILIAEGSSEVVLAAKAVSDVAGH